MTEGEARCHSEERCDSSFLFAPAAATPALLAAATATLRFCWQRRPRFSCSAGGGGSSSPVLLAAAVAALPCCLQGGGCFWLGAVSIRPAGRGPASRRSHLSGGSRVTMPCQLAVTPVCLCLPVVRSATICWAVGRSADDRCWHVIGLPLWS